MRISASACLAMLLAGPAIAQPALPALPVADPLPAILPAGISVRLEPFATVPNGAPQLIQSVGDESGGLAIN